MRALAVDDHGPPGHDEPPPAIDETWLRERLSQLCDQLQADLASFDQRYGARVGQRAGKAAQEGPQAILELANSLRVYKRLRQIYCDLALQCADRWIRACRNIRW